jgi:uncharacterized membrane protein YedE/YeeE
MLGAGIVFEGIDRAVEMLGPAGALALAGLLVGLLFGFMAQRSRFCLRSAVIEFVTAQFGDKLAIWLLTFGVAFAGIQFLVVEGLLDVAGTRALAARGSLSGAMIGGLLFGCGMILARGCASRLLVLSATGNLRALISGLIFVVVAQASYQGLLEPLRLALTDIWMIDGGPARDLVLSLGGRESDKLPVALGWLGIAAIFAARGRVPLWGWIGGIGAGLSVVLAYFLTHQIGLAAMETGTAKGVTFSGPSAEVLMRVLMRANKPVGFDTLLVPGVFLGSAVAALLAREWRLTVFDAKSGMLRYVIGAALMGFGSMLAGGCAVGAGISGGAIFAITAWLALLGMWIGAGAMHWMLDEARPVVSAAVKSGRLARS